MVERAPIAAWAALGISLLTLIMVVSLVMRPASDDAVTSILDVSSEVSTLSSQVDDLERSLAAIQKSQDDLTVAINGEYSNPGSGIVGRVEQLVSDSDASAADIARRLDEIAAGLDRVCSSVASLSTGPLLGSSPPRGFGC